MSEAKRRVSKIDIEEYGRKAARYVKTKDFSKQANDEMRLYNATMKINRLELLKANIGLELVAGFDELQKYFEEKLTNRTMDEFKRQSGILGRTVQNNEKAAHAIVNASFKNATYSDAYLDVSRHAQSRAGQSFKNRTDSGEASNRACKTSAETFWSKCLQCQPPYDHRACKGTDRGAKTVIYPEWIYTVYISGDRNSL